MAPTLQTEGRMKHKHKHYDLIVQWAAGAKIEMFTVTGEWVYIESPTWKDDTSYRVMPEVNYPKSTLDYTQLCYIVNDASDYRQRKNLGEGVQTIIARMAADAAIKHFIKSGEFTKYIKENK